MRAVRSVFAVISFTAVGLVVTSPADASEKSSPWCLQKVRGDRADCFRLTDGTADDAAFDVSNECSQVLELEPVDCGENQCEGVIEVPEGRLKKVGFYQLNIYAEDIEQGETYERTLAWTLGDPDAKQSREGTLDVELRYDDEGVECSDSGCGCSAGKSGERLAADGLLFAALLGVLVCYRRIR